jgi:adenosylcobinamide-GDP ribazoletransferase
VIAPLAALSFLTRLPVPGQPPAMRDVARAQGWFAAVGLLAGMALVGVDRLAMRALPPASVDVLVVVALIIVTGALHLDGLADSADGLFGGGDRERRLTIMRDARTGAFGATAIAGVLALKWAGLQALTPDVRVEALLVTPCAARAALVAAIAAYPYARSEGTGVDFRAHALPLALPAAGATAAGACVLAFGAAGLGVLALATGCSLAAGMLARRLLGGLTGDIYGGIVEVTEACTLLFIAAMAQRGWLDAWLLA